MLPRRVSMTLACAGAAVGLLGTAVATLPAAAAAGAVPSAAARAPQDDPAPTSGSDPSQSGIVTIVPTSAAAPTTEVPTTSGAASSEPPTRSAAATRARTTSRASATATALSSRPTSTRTRAVTGTAAATTTQDSGSGGSGTTYNTGPVDLPTGLAASQGPVVLVPSKAAGGKSVLVPASSTPERKVGSFRLSSVLITTVIGALIAAAVGGAGLWFTRRQGTRLSEADEGTSLPG